jgi:hypothetical protein
MPSVMRPRFGEEHYPIGRLVLHQARTLGLTRTMIVQRLGYSDLSNGQQALTNLLMTGTSPPFFTRLADALEVDTSIVESVLIATARQQDAEAAVHMLGREEAYRQAFRPHLQVQVERDKPSPIFLAAMLGIKRLRIIDSRDLDAAADDTQRDEIVGTIIRQHYRDNAGRVSCFGKITGYVLVSVPGYDGVDYGLPLDVDGYPIGSMISVPRLSEAMLNKRRADRDGRLNSLYRNRLIQRVPDTAESRSAERSDR